MGNQLAAVKFPDGLIMYTTFNDTSDILSSDLYGDMPSLDLRRTSVKKCSCHKREQERIEIVTLYGMYWTGKGCRRCKVVTDQQNPFDEGWAEIIKGAPDLKHDYFPDWYPFEVDFYSKPAG